MSYPMFGLTLMVTHACNMRCGYCYTGSKFERVMPHEVGDTAVRRAVASVERGGHLDVGFFGGEPLLQAATIRRWMELGRSCAGQAGIEIAFQVTTNGTINTPAAWDVLGQQDLRVAVSCDGLPAVHDRFRIYADGGGSAAAVARTVARLRGIDKPLSVVMVVRPETVGELAAGIRYLRTLGVRHIEPSLDLWTQWTRADAAVLRRSISAAAELWADGLPEYSVTWFDEKAAELAGMRGRTARCGFGDGEVAVAPSGNLYPCERLIGEDAGDHPLRLPGHVLDGNVDFVPHRAEPGRQADGCRGCALHGLCNTFCRCANYVRTGDVRHPDGLLCMLNQACLEEVAARVPPARQAAGVPVCVA